MSIPYNAFTMKNFLEKWKNFAIRFANFQIKLVLHLIYFVLILPYRLVFAIKELFAKKPFEKSGCWVDIKEKSDTIDSLRRQF